MPTTYVRVEYATSEADDLTYPTTWYFLTRTASSGPVKAPPQAARTRVWFRQRTEKHGFAPTPWVLAGSVVVGEHTPAIQELRVKLHISGLPTVLWSANSNTLGVRLDWSVDAHGEEPGYGATDDVDAADGMLVLVGYEADYLNRVNVRATPYSGFSAGAVSGIAGEPRYAYADMSEPPLATQEVTGEHIAAGSALFEPSVS